jgi:hypothetical protein
MRPLSRYPDPIVVGHVTERLYCVEPGSHEAIVPSNMKALRTGLEDSILIPSLLKPRAQQIKGTYDMVADGNRGAVLPNIKIEHHGRTFVLSLKGIGAKYPMYGDGLLEADGVGVGFKGYTFSSESWFGESPWGAMSYKACTEDKALTELSGPDGINGFHICPMVRANPLPEWVMETARPMYWYRRLNGPAPYYQQARLVPSDVRLFYQSEEALGHKTTHVLDCFKVEGLEALDGFMDNYILSGMAALTLIARTARTHKTWGHTALDYDDVWLDKDSLIAPDGTLFFADIEGLDWVPLRDEQEATKRITKQFDRNFYEFMYGLDKLLNERDRCNGRPVDRQSRRKELASRLELALAKDRYLKLERDGEHLDIFIRPAQGPAREVKMRFLDFDDQHFDTSNTEGSK